MAPSLNMMAKFGLSWMGYKRAVVYTVASTRHIKQVTVALSLYEYNYEGKSSCVDNEYLLWELREGTADTATGLTNSSLITSGTWRINDRSLWPLYSVQYKTATFSVPIEHDSTKYYFLVIKTESEVANSLYYPVWWGGTGYEKSFYHDGTSWTAYTAGEMLFWIDVPTDQAGVKYHVVIDGRGYMTPDNLGSYDTGLATQFGGVLRGGQSRHSQLTYPYSSFSQDTFRHGMGWTYFEDPQTFYFGHNLDTRVEGQVILAPRMIPAPVAGLTEYHLAEERLELGLPWDKHATPGHSVLKIAQRVWVSTSKQITGVWCWIRKEFLQSKLGHTLTFKLCSDYFGDPGGAVRTAVITDYECFDWHDMSLVHIDFTDYGTPPINEYMWLTFEVDDVGNSDGPSWSITTDPSASFAQSGKTTEFKYYKDGGWIEDTGYDFQFFLNFGAFPTGNAHFAEFEGYLYVAAGPSIYRWNESSKIWEVKVDGSGYGGDCTGLIVFTDKLWAAWGSAHVVQYMTDPATNNWADSSGNNANLFFVAQGFLWKSNPVTTDQHKCYYSNDGTSWSAAISIGSSETKITGFCLFNDVVVPSKEDGLWYIDRDHLAHSYFDYEDQKYSKNGENLKVWSNNIYIPILSGLWRWTGSSVDTLGPDRRAGLPKKWDGYIRDIISCANWMFVAVDGGTTSWSQVLCYNGIGWLPFIRGRYYQSEIRRLFLTSTIGSELRLWVMEGKSCYYCKLPYTRENHFEWADARYEPEGTLVTSWWNGGLFNAQKYFKDITIEIDGLIESGDDKTWLDVWYQVDGNEDLMTNQEYLGRITVNTPTTLKFGKELIAYSIRFIFKLGSTNAKYSPRLKSYNVDCIVRPDPAYVTSIVVSLADNIILMDKSESPYTAEDLWEHLKMARAKKEPIIISLPWGTIYGFISALRARTRQYKEAGVPTWEQTGILSIVEA